eukprot:CAMPEP_0198307204 /NCGR_PEP_ID=MMETSP1450-20131203/117_1 /TAXON_ID=753684 ORGANISM="Madagascaria erythrocladiodes, Strain CCMP3234" /NCGR_SAMPLE_ID=MMETSP1450 /ASSEMBLY_ACC=CAM_ASM_001115 /LENGTH=151 /DNA_ID=CAMNT_0044009769 /DNA_START=68 /DNA_END=523 /DNA_ORIENTATION=+
MELSIGVVLALLAAVVAAAPAPLPLVNVPVLRFSESSPKSCARLHLQVVNVHNAKDFVVRGSLMDAKPHSVLKVRLASVATLGEKRQVTRWNVHRAAIALREVEMELIGGTEGGAEFGVLGMKTRKDDNVIAESVSICTPGKADVVCPVVN